MCAYEIGGAGGGGGSDDDDDDGGAVCTSIFFFNYLRSVCLQCLIVAAAFLSLCLSLSFFLCSQ